MTILVMIQAKSNFQELKVFEKKGSTEKERKVKEKRNLFKKIVVQNNAYNRESCFENKNGNNRVEPWRQLYI